MIFDAEHLDQIYFHFSFNAKKRYIPSMQIVIIPRLQEMEILLPCGIQINKQIPHTV